MLYPLPLLKFASRRHEHTSRCKRLLPSTHTYMDICRPDPPHAPPLSPASPSTLSDSQAEALSRGRGRNPSPLLLEGKETDCSGTVVSSAGVGVQLSSETGCSSAPISRRKSVGILKETGDTPALPGTTASPACTGGSESRRSVRSSVVVNSEMTETGSRSVGTASRVDIMSTSKRARAESSSRGWDHSVTDSTGDIQRRVSKGDNRTPGSRNRLIAKVHDSHHVGTTIGSGGIVSEGIVDRTRPPNTHRSSTSSSRHAKSCSRADVGEQAREDQGNRGASLPKVGGWAISLPKLLPGRLFGSTRIQEER